MNRAILALCVLLFGVLPSARACTIPVFRYALEKWELATYEVLVYHHGPLASDIKKSLDAWSKPGRVNAEITLIDLDQDDGTNLGNNRVNLWLRHWSDQKTPWMVVRYHPPREAAYTAWSGPCTVANVASVMDSPMRQAILGHLTRGPSAVFVVMTSGDAKKDKAAYDLVRDQAKLLEKKITLPEQSKEGPQIQLPLPLKVSLPMLVLDRKQPAEAGLVSLLLSTEAGLDKVEGPIVFVIFGRGRALASLSGDELTAENMAAATMFLCGKCSCDVKDLNPGVDLLLAANWKEITDKLFDGKQIVPAPAESLGTFPTSAPVEATKDISLPTPTKTTETPKESPNAPSAPPSQRPHESPSMTAAPEPPTSDCPLCRNWLWIATGAAGVLVIATGWWVVVTLQNSSAE